MSAAGEIWNAAQMEAMAAHLDDMLTRSLLGIQTFIDTTPVMPCGCRQGMCTGHPLISYLPPCVRPGETRPVLSCDEAVPGPRKPCGCPGGAPCGCGAHPEADPQRYEIRECDGVRTYWVNGQLVSRDDLYRRELARLTREELAELADTVIADAESCGKPAEKPGIPLWDEDKHAALAEMSGPMTLPEDQLPAYDAVPPGCCTGCRLPVPAGQATCHYCDLAKQSSVAASTAIAKELDDRKAAEPERIRRGCRRACVIRDGRCQVCGRFARRVCEHGSTMQCMACYRPPRRIARPFMQLVMGFALFCIAVHVWPVLVFPAVLLTALGLHNIKRQL